MVAESKHALRQTGRRVREHLFDQVGLDFHHARRFPAAEDSAAVSGVSELEREPVRELRIREIAVRAASAVSAIDAPAQHLSAKQTAAAKDLRLVLQHAIDG